MADRRRGRWTAGLGVAAALLLTACAGIPVTGDVVVATPPVDDGTLPDVQILATSPQPGDSPVAIVRGFLDAMSSQQAQPTLAYQYLTEQARDVWDRTAITVYGGDLDTVALDSPIETEASVRITGSTVASIDQSGLYSAAGPTDVVDYNLRLERVGTEWRIADVPPRLLIPVVVLRNDYAPYVTYFPSLDGTTLIPDQIRLPARTPDLPRRLAQQVVDGPTTLLQGAVRVPFPAGTTVEQAVQSNDVLTITLSPEAATAASADRRLMAAALTETMVSAIPGVRVALDAGGEDFAVAGLDGVLGADDFASFDPLDRFGGPSAYVVDDRGVRRVDPQTGGRQAVEGVLGGTPVDADALAVDLSEAMAATVDQENGQVWATPISDSGASRRIFAGTDVAVPSWDRFGDLWVVDRPTPASSAIYLIPDAATIDTEGGSGDGASAAGEPVEVVAPVLEETSTAALRVAPDGVRVAAVTGTGPAVLRIGSIHRDADSVRIEVPVSITLGGTVTEVAWLGATELVVMVTDPEGTSQPWRVSIDGYSLQSEPVSEVRSLAGYSGRPLLAISAADNLLRATAASWDTLGSAELVVYPG